MENILISACLLGVKCRYSGGGKRLPEIDELMKRYHLIPVCPEVYGGLPTPREPAEQSEGKVITCTGQDVTAEFERGACEVVELAKLYECPYALLKERSPSCGCGKVYDGSFSGRLIDGNGVLAGMLLERGIAVAGETGIKEALLGE